MSTKPTATIEMMRQAVRSMSSNEGLLEAFHRILKTHLRKHSLYMTDKEFFFAGALCVFSSMMVAMDDSREETQAELDFVQRLHEELNNFETGFQKRLKI